MENCLVEKLCQDLQEKSRITPENFEHIFNVQSSHSLIPIKGKGKLYLCNRYIINNYSNYNIDYLISMIQVPKLKKYIQHDIYEIEDKQNIEIIEKMKNIIDEVLPKIHQSIESGKTVGVHCYAGISRSATIVVAYLMKYENYKFEEAIQCVFEARPIIRPNIGFLKLLKEL